MPQVQPLQDPGDVEAVRDGQAAQDGLGHDLVELPGRRDLPAAGAAVPQRVPEPEPELAPPVEVVAPRQRLVRSAEGDRPAVARVELGEIFRRQVAPGVRAFAPFRRDAEHRRVDARGQSVDGVGGDLVAAVAARVNHGATGNVRVLDRAYESVQAFEVRSRADVEEREDESLRGLPGRLQPGVRLTPSAPERECAPRRMNAMAPPGDLRAWIALLEREGELVRVSAEVDADLEITEINDRVVKSGGPALLFENVKGSSHPLLINQFGTERRMCLAFGASSLDEVARRLGDVLEMQPPEGLVAKVKGLQKLKSIADSRPKTVRSGPAQEVVLTGDDVDLDLLPIQRCWPGDPAPFITLPAVITHDPRDGRATSACTGCRRSTSGRR